MAPNSPKVPSPAKQGRSQTKTTAKPSLRIQKQALPGPTRASRRLRGLDPQPDGTFEVLPGRFFLLVPANSAATPAGRLLTPTSSLSGNETSSVAVEAEPFNFLGLPAEIRQMVYRELLRSTNPIDIDWKCPRLHPQILQTCKTVFFEAHSVLYEENTWKLRIGGVSESLFGRPSPLFDKERTPRHLDIVIDCSCSSVRVESQINIIGRSLAALPEIRSLVIRCEKVSKGFWRSEKGTELRDRIRTYLCGRIRHVKTIQVTGTPKALATEISRVLMGSTPRSALLLSWEAFGAWKFSQCRRAGRFWQCLYTKPFSDFYCEAMDAMERGDRKAYLFYRGKVVERIKGIKDFQTNCMEELYQYDEELDREEKDEQVRRALDHEVAN
ncbi:hypothetical protein QBC34DRAFT_430161 [Podospora aff. communis PSN243]|uniref:Uncharacterized protein n=1 Tax=Podospora aff. communis PSN243 TaxID=3040156 RepID=A0AAV9G6C4_9PEZI|nr:hypothetical protein QBC34DRAFT_430161 [Podospora aff. communis PSN243]